MTMTLFSSPPRTFPREPTIRARETGGDFHALAEARRSVRSYLSEPVPQDVFDAICLNQEAVQTTPLLIAVVARWDTWRRNRRFVLQERSRRGIVNNGSRPYVPMVYANGPLNVAVPFKRLLEGVLSRFKPIPSLPSPRIIAHKCAALSAGTLMLA